MRALHRYLLHLLLSATLTLAAAACSDSDSEGDGATDVATDSSGDASGDGDTTDGSGDDASGDGDTTDGATDDADTADGDGDGDTTDGDTTDGVDGDTTDGVAPDLADGGDYLTEGAPPDGDFPDCITGCPNALSPDGGLPASVINLGTFARDGVLAKIDDGCHEIILDGASSRGPDSDVFAFSAAARTMVDITVVPQNEASLQPLIIGLQGPEIIGFNFAQAPGESARTVFAAPYLGDLPFQVVIEDDRNASILGDSDAPFTSCADFVGGDAFTYTLEIDTYAFAPVELGVLDAASTPLTAAGETLGQTGDIRYYRFSTTNSNRFTITITKGAGASTSFTPFTAGMNTIEGQLVWEGTASDTGSGAITLTDDDLRACFDQSSTPEDECAGEGEYVFAVLDYDGRGGVDYTYDVTVTLD